MNLHGCMSVLHPGLIYGLILATIPVVLHLMMRSRPKRFDFPALRLLENIRKQNVQRMRLRHLGLLLLRILLLALIVLAVARPTLPAANYGLTGSEWFRLLLVIIGVCGLYLLGRRQWVQKTPAASQRLLRQSWLRAGSVLAGILLLLLFVAWPYQKRVSGEIRHPGDMGKLNVPVAAVLMFDVSISMQYRHENETRLQQGYRLAQQQVSGLPAGSRIAVGDNAGNTPLNFLSDLSAAATRLQRTESQQPKATTLPLNDRLLSAIKLQQTDREQVLAEAGGRETDRFIREIYVFTDRTKAGWSLDRASRLRQELEQTPWLRVYVIDVGVEPAVNYGLSHLELSRERIVQGGLVRVSCTVSNQSPRPVDLDLELHLDERGGSSLKRDQQSLNLEAGATQQVGFTFPAEQPGILQGEIQLTNTDPLESDNRLPFSVLVESRPRLWLVAESEEEAFVWEQALAPEALVERGVHQYETRVLPPQRLTVLLNSARADATQRPDVIYLINLSRLSSPAWTALRDYVGGGGGLGVILGHARVEALNYREYGQADWLPGLPAVHSRANPPVNLDVRRAEHPVFDYLRRLDALTLLSATGVRRFWKLEPRPEGDVLARFTDEGQSPAVLVGSFQRGRVMMLGTAVDLRGAITQDNWSDLARLSWIYAAWADQLTKYLRGLDGGRLNRPAGETVLLSIPADVETGEMLLQLPGLRQGRIRLPYRGPFLSLRQEGAEVREVSERPRTPSELGATELGHYRVRFADQQRPDLGFSIHLPDEETSLIRLSDADLDTLFGPDRWETARSYEELERTVLLGRIGQEAYPLLVTLLLVFFVGEHLVANLFYGRVE